MPPQRAPVILTKVRTQDTERRRIWLWVLTFVRMTDWMEYSWGTERPKEEGRSLA